MKSGAHVVEWNYVQRHVVIKKSNSEVNYLDKMMLLAAVAGIAVVGGYLLYFNFL